MALETADPLPDRDTTLVTRRRFLKLAGAGVLTAPALVSCTRVQPAPPAEPQPAAPTAPPRPRAISPNEKIQHACIGVGGMGEVDLKNFLQHPRVQVVALCDVDDTRLQAAAAVAPGARLYRDWRELLAHEADAVDSVNVAVPDHMHFAIACSAVLRAKHVYCQKPLCHDVAEVRYLTEAAAKAGVVTQLGIQMAASAHERLAVRWLQEGRIGKITRAYLCSNRPGAVENYRLPGPRPPENRPPPDSLDWNLWLGTAPVRPYVPDIYHPVKWRAWQDFGTGWSGDIGCHVFSAVWRGLGLTAPLTVTAEVQESWQRSPARRADTWPQGDHITWIFPGNDRIAGPTLEVDWYDGEFYPPEHIRRLYSPDLKEYPAESAMLLGTDGALLIPLGYPPQLLPEARFTGPRPELSPRNHYHHFIDACLGKEQTEAHFGITGPMSETVLLGTIAIRLPKAQLQWNAKAMSFASNPEANQLLSRKYREDWSVAAF